MDRASIRRLWVATVAVGSLALGTVEANAGAFGLHEQSAVGQGMSFAGAGTPGMGLSAMFWNPAAVTQTTGVWSETHGALVLPSTNVTAVTGTSATQLALGRDAGNIGELGLIPASYAAYRINPNFFVGLSINSPYGLSTSTRQPWAGQQVGVSARAKSMDVNPVLGWKINDMISVAAGPRLVWFKGEFARAPSPTVGAPNAALNLDDYGWGFSAGVTLTPWRGTEIALGYRSQVNMGSLKGDANVTPGGAIPVGIYNISASATLPDQASLGVRQRINEAFTVLGTVEWTHWSTLWNVPITLTSGPATGSTLTTLTFNFRDGWMFAIGGEYDLNPQTTLRAGIAYEVSPVTDQYRDTTLPDANRWWFSAGFTYRGYKFLAFDAGYSFIYGGTVPITVNAAHPDRGNLLPGPGTLLADSTASIHIISAGLRFKWDEMPGL